MAGGSVSSSDQNKDPYKFDEEDIKKAAEGASKAAGYVLKLGTRAINVFSKSDPNYNVLVEKTIDNIAKRNLTEAFNILSTMSDDEMRSFYERIRPNDEMTAIFKVKIKGTGEELFNAVVTNFSKAERASASDKAKKRTEYIENQTFKETKEANNKFSKFKAALHNEMYTLGEGSASYKKLSLDQYGKSDFKEELKKYYPEQVADTILAAFKYAMDLDKALSKEEEALYSKLPDALKKVAHECRNAQIEKRDAEKLVAKALDARDLQKPPD